MSEAQDLIFAGLKVLDVGSWIAGPVAATILADFGADVIKVESPTAGDGMRNLAFGPMMPSAPMNYTWLADARNKRGITLNLRSEEGYAILMRLVDACDVYVTNQPFPQRRAFKLTYKDLAPRNPRMIYASLSAYGETGPDADQEGFDGVAWWARSGLMEQVRAPGAMPGGSVPGMGDHPTAVSLYAGIVTALLRRERTGQGAEVHTSLLANGVWSNSNLIQGSLAGADFSARYVRSMQVHSPQRALYETADGRLLQLYMVRTAEQFDRLLMAAERLDLLEDERFGSAEARMANGAAFVEAMRDMFRTRTAKEWMALFRANDVPVTLVALTEETAQDEQIHAAGAFVKPVDERIGMPYVVNHPINITGMPVAGPTKAPDQGEHTDEVLAELGYSAAEIRRLHDEGIV